MKRTIISMVLTVVVSMLFCMYGSAEEGSMVKGSLYVNDTLIESEDTILIQNNLIIFPFRTIMEALGATVSWDEKTGDTTMEYEDEVYLCTIKEPSPGHKFFYVKKTSTDQYLFLNPMSFEGGYRMINDRTYLYQQSGEYLCKALGIMVDVDAENQTVRISKPSR